MQEQPMSPEDDLFVDDTPPTLIEEMGPYLSEWIDGACEKMNFFAAPEQKLMIRALVDEQLDLLKKQGHTAVTAKGMAILMISCIMKIQSFAEA